MLIWIGVSCRISYCVVSCLYVSFLFPRLGKRDLSCTCNYVVSVLLFVLRIGCVILLWHSLGLLYSYLLKKQN